MAIEKATTTEDLTASAKDTLPTREQMVERVVEHSDPNTVAKVDSPKAVKLKSPADTVVEVPEGIVSALLDSGYSKTK